MKDNITLHFVKEVQQKTGIIGNSESIQNAVYALLEVADTELAVLITGETGTGKEVFANAVHSLSKRKDKPFISVNCGAIPETLLESELFGHEKGAFTSAIDQRIGFFEAANNGTIFLDEIGDMPHHTQVKLLRILESGEFSRLGSSKILKVNIRLITATNKNLMQEIKEKKFRQDLFYRLNQFSIVLPPLREHRHDIPLYFEHFATAICKKNNIDYQGITDDAIAILKSLHWQGNIREFKNFTEKMIILEKGKRIDADIVNEYIPHILPDINFQIIDSSHALVPTHKETNLMSNDTLILKTLLEIKQDIIGVKQIMGSFGAAFQILNDEINSIKDAMLVYQIDKQPSKDKIPTLKEMERQMIIQTLEHCRHNKRETAQILGISERTLYRKIDEYKIDEM
jgi:DNA-binding NtrC family response regulator